MAMMQAMRNRVNEQILRSMLTLDSQLKTQKKAREEERQIFQQDTFLRSRALEDHLAARPSTRAIA